MLNWLLTRVVFAISYSENTRTFPRHQMTQTSACFLLRSVFCSLLDCVGLVGMVAILRKTFRDANLQSIWEGWPRARVSHVLVSSSRSCESSKHLGRVTASKSFPRFSFQFSVSFQMTSLTSLRFRKFRCTVRSIFFLRCNLMYRHLTAPSMTSTRY